jgi:hypothetical protein
MRDDGAVFLEIVTRFMVGGAASFVRIGCRWTMIHILVPVLSITYDMYLVQAPVGRRL